MYFASFPFQIGEQEYDRLSGGEDGGEEEEEISFNLVNALSICRKANLARVALPPDRPPARPAAIQPASGHAQLPLPLMFAAPARR